MTFDNKEIIEEYLSNYLKQVEVIKVFSPLDDNGLIAYIRYKIKYMETSLEEFRYFDIVVTNDYQIYLDRAPGFNGYDYLKFKTKFNHVDMLNYLKKHIRKIKLNILGI